MYMALEQAQSIAGFRVGFVSIAHAVLWARAASSHSAVGHQCNVDPGFFRAQAQYSLILKYPIAFIP